MRHAWIAVGFIGVSGCFSPNVVDETETLESSGAASTMGTSLDSGNQSTSTDGTGSSTDGGATSTQGSPTAGTEGGETSVDPTVADTTETGNACPAGELGCPCDDGSCTDLACVDDVCTEAPEGMVFIPGGMYMNGPGPAGNNPTQERTVGDLFFERTEVTVQAYQACVGDGACVVPNESQCLGGGQFPDETPAGNSNYAEAGRALHPVNCVNYEEAVAYCSWAGRRLPTEWEWEWAARGEELGTVYPWGDAPEPNCENTVGNFAGNTSGCGTGEPAVVGSRSPAGDTSRGLQDMAGNVYEWTSSANSGGMSRQVRGGSYRHPEDLVRVDRRDDSDTTNRYDDSGLRCVVDP